MDIRIKLREFITENMLVFGDNPTFADDNNLFKMGYVNSLFAMKLLSFVEREFNIKIESDEMQISNFSSIDNIFNLIIKKQSVG